MKNSNEIPPGKDTIGRTKSLDRVRREHIEDVLESTHGDLAESGRILGITQAELKRWLRKLGIG